jgi:SAM-dependent methyltransferase
MRLWHILRYGPGVRGKARKREKTLAAHAAQFADKTAWTVDGALVRRKYGSYADYLAHQAAKLDGIAGKLKKRQEHDFADFKQRFESCSWLADAHCVLCLGARLGTEVQALRALGHFAVGIDVNPGPKNSGVMYGDFHHIDFPDRSVDAIYTNALDHAFDLDKVLGEVSRLLRPGGVFVADIVVGFTKGYVPGEFETLAWTDPESFIGRICASGPFAIRESRSLADSGSSNWRQVVFSPSAPEPASLAADERRRAAGNADAAASAAGPA